MTPGFYSNDSLRVYQLTPGFLFLKFYSSIIDREFVTSAKKFANFNEFSEFKKIRKNS